MKIDNSVKSAGQVASESRTRSARETSASPATAAGTQVALSGGLQKYEQLVAQAPVVDGNRVEELKQAISSGQFKVNPEKVADGLISSVRQMLAAQPSAA